MRCGGCKSHKNCTYGIRECQTKKMVKRCAYCIEYPCKKIIDILKTTRKFEKNCRNVCTPTEYKTLKKAFFEKEKNLK